MPADLSDPVSADESRDGGGQGVLAQTARVLQQIGTQALEDPVHRGYHERLTQPTLTNNSLTCEDGGDHRTIIPNVAVAKCDMRIVGGAAHS